MSIDLSDVIGGKRSLHLSLNPRITVRGIGAGKPADH